MSNLLGSYQCFPFFLFHFSVFNTDPIRDAALCWAPLFLCNEAFVHSTQQCVHAPVQQLVSQVLMHKFTFRLKADFVYNLNLMNSEITFEMKINSQVALNDYLSGRDHSSYHMNLVSNQ